MSKRTKEDLNKLKKLKPIKPDWEKGLKGVDYSIIDFSFKRDMSEIYDEIFLFLYEAPYYYTLILNKIDELQKEFGYFTPIPYGFLANLLNLTKEQVDNTIYQLRRKGIILEYKDSMMRIRCSPNKNKIYKRMLVRHPTITLNKPLGYKE